MHGIAPWRHAPREHTESRPLAHTETVHWPRRLALAPRSHPPALFVRVCPSLPCSQLYALTVSDLYKVLDKFPTARKELGEYLFEDVIRHRMLRYWALRMLVGETQAASARQAAALRLQVGWLKHAVISLQREAMQPGALEKMMPAVHGFGPEYAEKDLASARSLGAPSGRGSPLPTVSEEPPKRVAAAAAPAPARLVSPEKPPPRLSSPDASAVVVGTTLSALEGERSALRDKDAKLQAKIGAIEAALEKLVGEALPK